MPKYGQLIMGPAGSGKSTYCSVVKEFFDVQNRNCHIVNLDPAAEGDLKYEPTVDIRNLIVSREIGEDFVLGPNGALVACMEALVEPEGLDWLEDQVMGSFGDDDYILFDCPGQIELYSHIPVIRKLVDFLSKHCDFRLCGVYCVDCLFVTDKSKYIAASFSALAAMINLELPHINVLTKCDLMPKSLSETRDDEDDDDAFHCQLGEGMDPKYLKLNEAMRDLLQEFSLVKFQRLNISDEESIEDVLREVNNAINFGEDLEPREEDYLGAERAEEKQQMLREESENRDEKFNSNREGW